MAKLAKLGRSVMNGKLTAIRVVESLLVASLAGCAQYQWQKYGATQDEFNRDAYECQMAAANAYPSVIVQQQLTSGYQTAATTNCYSNGSAFGAGGSIYGSSNTTCTTTPGRTVQPVTYTTDANADNRARAANACMYAHGYQRVRVK